MAVIVLTREMGLSHRDFFRLLPRVLEGRPVHISGSVMVVDEGQRRLTIMLAPAGERRIASLCLPVSRVTLEFSGYSDADIGAFRERCARHSRVLKEPAKVGSVKGHVNELHKMLPEYYRLHGWNEDSRLSAKTRWRLGA